MKVNYHLNAYRQMQLINASHKRCKECVLGKVAMNQLLCDTAAAAALLLG